MKRKSILSAILLASTMVSLTSCGALWTTSTVDTYPDYYDMGIYNNYYPTPPGSPWITPVYWGSQLYPSQPVPPSVRPTRPGNSSMYPGGNRPTGNSRPANTPATQPDHVPVPTGNQSNSVVPPAGTFNPSSVTGGEPGIVTPPAGSGLRPGATRH